MTYCPYACDEGWIDYEDYGTPCPLHPPKEPVAVKEVIATEEVLP